MRACLIALVSLFVSSVVDARSQGWSITAHAPVVGSAQAYATQLAFHTSTLPVGPVPAGLFLTSSTSFGRYIGSASVSTHAVWHPWVTGQTGPLAFRASLDAAGQLVSLFSPASVGLLAQIDLTLSAPSPVGGRLHVRTSASALGGAGSSLVFDLGADGSTEALASTSFAASAR